MKVKGMRLWSSNYDHNIFKSFEFVFLLHLIDEILGYTNELCKALQKREQDAMDLLEFTNVELDVLREDS
jgi:hypothetical protein